MKRRDLIVAALLAAACLAVFGQAAHFDFINYDDNAYVTENPNVTGGPTVSNVVWAFTTIDYFYWQPVTWVSHMVDCRVFGVTPAGPHVVNILLHVLNSILLFLVLRRMMGRPLANARGSVSGVREDGFWRCAVLAALFALHPLRLESVVWISERKDVLSTFFLLVMLWAYLEFVERPSRPRYLAVLAAFALGLMSKPMLITAPVLLLILDWWPLRRRAFADKAPLFLMAAITLGITYLGTARLQAINWAAGMPLGHRIANAMVNYLAYIELTIWPHNLAILYPYRLSIPPWQPVAAAIAIVAISAAAWRLRRSRPYLLAGWLWFALGILPPIGIVQMGRQAMADRFMYVPLIGLGLMAVWGLGDVLRERRVLAAALAGGAIAACAAVSLAHVGTWRDSVAVFSNAVTVTRDNPGAQHYLGAALDDLGRYDEALAHHAESVRLDPTYYIAQNCYALDLERRGDWAAAAEHFGEAVRYFPNYAEARFHMGLNLKRLGRAQEGREQLQAALGMGLSDGDAATARRELERP
jgi:tetratricopeptide (TPR) repeat protein